jgi:hypothetical protein
MIRRLRSLWCRMNGYSKSAYCVGIVRGAGAYGEHPRLDHPARVGLLRLHGVPVCEGQARPIHALEGAAVNFLHEDEPIALTPTVQVRLELRARPGVYLTTVELARLTGLSRIQVATAIYCLRSQSNIRRRVEGTRGGRNTGQAYAWRDGGACPNCGRG